MSRWPERTPDERFDSKWEVDPSTGCHVWTAAHHPEGYGRFWVSGSTWKQAHTFAYERKYGPVPAGLVLDHFVCDRPTCCNPDHVRPVTIKQNVDRSPTAFVARTHCPQGHPYDESNTYWKGPGKRHRECRTCQRQRNRIASAKRRANARRQSGEVAA